MAIFSKRDSLSVFLMVLGSAGVCAQTFTIDGVTYSGNVEQKTCFIQAAEPSVVSIAIPQSVSYNSVDYQVISIGFGAFTDCAALESITIPASVTAIGNNAFNGCSGLASLTIADSAEPVTIGYAHDYTSGLDRGLFSECPLQTIYLGRNVTNNTHRFATFSGNDELTSLTISDQVTEISAFMFSGCSALESVTLPESVKSVGASAFSGCSALKSVTLPAGLESLGESAFFRCSALMSMNLPASLSEVPASAFAECASLETIALPATITTIGDGAFSGCSLLTGLSLPQGLTDLGSNVFSNCSALKSIAVPAAVSRIELAAFSDCTNLTSVELPEAVNFIGALAFSGCSSLSSITIPAAVTSIGHGAFTGCSSLKKLTALSGPETLELGFNTSALPALFGETPLEEVYLGRNVSYPADSRPFKGISTLKRLTIGAGMTTLDGTMFDSCRALTQLTFEDGDNELSSGSEGFADCPIATINLGRNFSLTDGRSPFSGMKALNKLNITTSASEICAELFRECPALTWLSVPVTVKNIDGGAFADCAILEGISFEDGNEPIVISAEGAFSGSPIKSIYLGRNLSAEIAPFSGLNLFKHITIGPGVTSIAPRVFRGCPALSKVTIEQGSDPLTIEEPVEEDTENTVKTLEIARNILGCGFRNFYNLSSVTVYDGISVIGANLFEGCTAMKSISLPESVISIGNYAFANCNALKKVNLPSSLSVIGLGAFSGCRALSSITLPASLTSISNETFAGCSTLPAIEIPATITSIGDAAFAECNQLNDVVIPESVASIGNGAFADCPNLTRLTIADSTEPISIQTSAFRFDKLQPADDSALKEIDLGRSVSFEEKSPFAELNNLTSVTVGTSVETLNASLFQTCANLAKVKLGSGLKTIEELVFLGCGALRSVRSEALTPPSAVQTAFPDDTYRFGTLYVADEAMQIYQTTTPWDLFRQLSSEPESGIEAIKANKESEIYDLRGIKLNAKPGRGIYIRNGKKTIIH